MLKIKQDEVLGLDVVSESCVQNLGHSFTLKEIKGNKHNLLTISTAHKLHYFWNTFKFN